jgi:hypothetical protein
MDLRFVGLVTTLPDNDDEWLWQGLKGLLKGFSWLT